MSTSAQQPNVIFVITDDQGYGDIAYHGNPWLSTPHLDKMAAESVQLDNHHHDPLCSPSRAAVMTGQYASRGGVWHVTQGRHLLRPESRTMANYFKDNGYATAMFGKWHLGDNYPYGPQYRGFDETVCHYGGGVGELPDYWGNDYSDDTYFRNGQPEAFSGYCTDVFFDEALNFIGKQQDKPFFVYLATNAMHSPFIVPERYAAPYLEQGVPEPRAQFYGMISNFDENMGRLFAYLKQHNLDDNTLVVFTADHGTAEGFDPETGDGFNAGLRGKKGSVYDGGHQVNFFMRWTRTLPPETRIKELTAHIDVLPTLIDLCQLETPESPEFDGESLVPIITRRAETLKERSIFVHLQPDKPVKWHHCVVMNGAWRLINGTALYNVDTDRAQVNDVALEHPDIVTKLRKDYDAWWDSLTPAFNDYCYFDLGGVENPTLLTARDWHPLEGTVPWMQDWIAENNRHPNGFWAVNVLQEGTYRITLRRYPKEAARPAGATNARLKIGELEFVQQLDANAEEAVFLVTLKAGKVLLQSWFTDVLSGLSRGAYYVYVSKES